MLIGISVSSDIGLKAVDSVIQLMKDRYRVVKFNRTLDGALIHLDMEINYGKGEEDSFARTVLISELNCYFRSIRYYKDFKCSPS